MYPPRCWSLGLNPCALGVYRLWWTSGSSAIVSYFLADPSRCKRKEGRLGLGLWFLLNFKESASSLEDASHGNGEFEKCNQPCPPDMPLNADHGAQWKESNHE